MSSFITRSRGHVARLWRVDAPLTATALVMLVALAAAAFGLVLDARLVLGAPVWLKPLKFAASIAIYCLTLLWIFSHIPGFARTRRIVGRVTAGALLLEMAIIGLQAGRGTTSHFNVSTPLDTTLWVAMGVTIVAQTLSTLAVAVALFRQRFADRGLATAMRLGMVITIAGAFLGGVMTRPTEAQRDDMRNGQVLVSGAHTVGAPDGGAGIAVTGWSREHGDLRVAHFVGLHALQVLPLAALALRRTRATEGQRARAVGVWAGSYAGLVGLLLWQALRGQAAFAPDAKTIAALLAWFLLTLALTWRALLARRLVPGNTVMVS